MKRVSFFILLISLIFIMPIMAKAKDCQYTLTNMGVKDFNLKMSIKKSSKYYLELDKKGSFMSYNGKKATFDTLLATKNLTFYKNFDASGTVWTMIDKEKCPEAVRYVTIKDHIYILLGDENKVNNATVVVGGHEYKISDKDAQTVLELEAVQQKNNNEETIKKYKKNLEDRIKKINELEKLYLEYGCYDKETYKHTTKKTDTGVSYIVWDNSDKVQECEKKLQTLNAQILGFEDDVDYFKNTFPKESSKEYEDKYNTYKKKYDEYKKFADSKGTANKNNGSSDKDVDKGKLQTGCEVIPEVVRKWINNILKFVRYVALALVIALGALDFMKAAGDGEPDAMKKAGQSFMKRMIAVVILFLLPVIVDFILNMVNIYGVDPNNIDCL